MHFEDSYFSRDARLSLGIETTSGRYYLSIPVSIGSVDYEEYYELSEPQYRRYLADPDAAVRFADSCRRHERDELLLQQPGRNRGTPT